MSKTIIIEPDRTYHIYNRGVNSVEMFMYHGNYKRFIKNMRKHLNPIGTVFAYCLMNNHFHFLIHTKTTQMLIKEGFILPNNDQDITINKINKQFSNLFNSYTRYFNIQQERTGPLYDSRFKRILVTTEEYFQQLIIYIHNNPVNHHVCKNVEDYEWSSIHDYLSDTYRKPFMEDVIRDFGGIANFKLAHKQNKPLINSPKY